MDIEDILIKIKKDFDSAIITGIFGQKSYENGLKAKEALIRSQKIIVLIHEFVKTELVKYGVPINMINPPVGSSHPEVKLKGFLKSKNQDVAVVPNKEILTFSENRSKDIEKILSINIRSQLSSLAKNIDTLYERTFAESLNLHLLYPKQCLGEVYLIPTHEYNDKSMLQNKVVFKSVSKIEDYIRMFQAINNRVNIDRDEYKYERVCLLIVDFRFEKPKLYDSIKELKKDGLIPEDSDISLEKLTLDGYFEDLFRIYKSRFGDKVII